MYKENRYSIFRLPSLLPICLFFIVIICFFLLVVVWSLHHSARNFSQWQCILGRTMNFSAHTKIRYERYAIDFHSKANVFAHIDIDNVSILPLYVCVNINTTIHFSGKERYYNRNWTLYPFYAFANRKTHSFNCNCFRFMLI